MILTIHLTNYTYPQLTLSISTRNVDKIDDQ